MGKLGWTDNVTIYLKFIESQSNISYVFVLKQIVFNESLLFCKMPSIWIKMFNHIS
jgi:hypothetical protein